MPATTKTFERIVEASKVYNKGHTGIESFRTANSGSGAMKETVCERNCVSRSRNLDESRHADESTPQPRYCLPDEALASIKANRKKNSCQQRKLQGDILRNSADLEFRLSEVDWLPHT